MAIDTKQKRASVTNLLIPGAIYVTPDDDIGRDDRQSIVYLYANLYVGPEPEPEPTPVSDPFATYTLNEITFSYTLNTTIFTFTL